MVTPMIRAIVTTLLILFASLSYATVNAEVDRSQVGEGESFTLTISSEDSSGDKPDLSMLEANFDVVGTSNSKNISIMNGQLSSQTSWQIQLIPKQVGTIIIPAINMGNEKTQPITIEVGKQSSASNTTTSNNISTKADANAFFQATVDKKEVYVQEQVIYTQRFYYRPELPIADISVDEPSINNASIEPLNTKGPRYEETINGVRYRVIEATYAIFPEKSGQLIIPARTLTVRMQTSMFEPLRQSRLTSDENLINVLPQPNHDNLWLPAKNLTAKETWSANPPIFKVGESVTRKITLEAEGLSQSHLPALPDIKIDGLKMYADKPETKNTVTLKGIVGTRTDSIAIVASKAGTYTLPAITISWWDTDDNQPKTAVIDAFTFTVADNIINKNTLPAPAVSASLNSVTATTAKDTTSFTDSIDRFWLSVAGIFLALWILTLLLWWRTYKKTNTFSKGTASEISLSTQKQNTSPKSTLEELSLACQSNHSLKARDALLKWAAIRWPTNTPSTLDDIAAKEPSLTDALRALEQTLYGKQPTHWEGAPLLALIKQLPAKITQTKDQKSPLESLYPEP
jgi:hypothetical protein